MRREWEPEDLIACWTLVEQDERELVAYKRGATRLGFALMLKFFEIDARFPRHGGEYPPAAVDYVARQVGVDPGVLADYDWSGRTVEYHRAQIRRALQFRRFSEEDEAKLAGWLAEEIAPVELSDERLREALLARCRSERIEPPARVDRILGTARAAVSDRFTTATVNRLTPATIAGLDALAGLGTDGQDPANGAWLAELKADPAGSAARACAARSPSSSGSAPCSFLMRCSRAGQTTSSPPGGPGPPPSTPRTCAGTSPRCG